MGLSTCLSTRDSLGFGQIWLYSQPGGHNVINTSFILLLNFCSLVPGRSQVVMRFSLHPSEVETIKHMQLQLHHCTSSTEGAIDIDLNGIPIHQYHLSPKWSFRGENFTLDRGFRPGVNTVRVVMSERTSGVYWLSKATVFVSFKCPKSLKDLSREYILGRGVDYCRDDVPKYLRYFLDSVESRD